MCGGGEARRDHPSAQYRFDTYLRGLQEHVTLIKTPGRVYARRADGSEMGVRALRELDANTWVSRHGRLTQGLVEKLSEVTSRVRVGVVYEDGATGPGLRAPSPLGGTPENADAVPASLPADRGLAFAARFEALGLQVTRVSKRMPFVFGLASNEQIENIGREPGVVLVFLAEHGAQVLHAAPNSATDSGISDAFNANGRFGTGERIGYSEGRSCGLYSAHEAFSSTSIVYSNAGANPSCAVDTDCETPCNTTVQELACASGKCAVTHASKVMSAAVSARGPDNWNAAKATLYYYNDSGFDGCIDDTIDDSYDWFVNQGVDTVVQSWGCYDYRDEGIVQDYYARYEGTFIAMAAGNTLDGKGVACPNSLNATCVGNHQLGGSAMYSTSNYENLENSDREEPDLTALGHNVEMAGFASTTDWATDTGTSFAAPQVGALAALIKADCASYYPGYNLRLMPYVLRGMLMSTSFVRNPEGWKYSSPGPHGLDHKDGAGGVYAGGLGNCGIPFGSGVDGPDGQVLVIEDEGLKEGEAGPDGRAPEIDGPPPGESSHPLDYGAPGSTDGRLYTKQWQMQLQAGARVRAILAWQSCPPMNYLPLNPTAPTQVAVDYDLFLYNATTAEYVYASQSFDDSNEGFDVIVPDAGTYQIYVAKPEGLVGCQGAGSEPYSLWTGYWY